MTRISTLDVIDVRFPTSRELDGSDAMNPEPDYSAAYVALHLDDDDMTGYSLLFTTGRGNDVACAAVRALEGYVLGRDVGELVGDVGVLARTLTWDGQLRWLGPEKGVMHMAIGAVVNAAWDLRCRLDGQPLWRVLAALTPEDIVRQIDFTYIDDVLTPGDALRILESQVDGRAERIAALETDGLAAYTTSVGWLGYDDDKVARLANRAVEDGFTMLKLKVGADRQSDIRRLGVARHGRSASGRGSPSMPIRGGESRKRSTGWPTSPALIRIGSRSRPHPTTCSATSRSVERYAPSVSPPVSTSRTGSSSSSCSRPRRSTSCRSTPVGWAASTRTSPSCS